MKHINDYLKIVRSQGRYAFTAEEALKILHISKNALNCGIYRLKKKGEIISPSENLYVIVPPEYQQLGSLPPNELVPILMKHWGIQYYVCLLSAAMHHGAAHQKPQVFQVMTNKQLRPIQYGRLKIEFIYKKRIEPVFHNHNIVKFTVNTGLLNVANPELTVMDLLHYPHKAGGLNHIATVLSELIETISPAALMELIKNSNEKTWIQRLGFILEKMDTVLPKQRDLLVNAINKYLHKLSLNFVPLVPELPVLKMPRANRWKIIENATVESDI